MKKRIAQLIVLSFFVFQSNTMDVPCYLTKMPKNVVNNIASFLGWEAEEAFVKRTSKKSSNKILSYCLIKSFDNTKAAMLNFDGDEGTFPYLNVFEIRHQKKIKIVDVYLPEECVFTALDFNQQGTHCLLRATHYDGEGQMRKERMMIKLHALDYDKKIDKQNALQQYLRHQLVCKKTT